MIVPDEEFSVQKCYTSLMQSDGFMNAAAAAEAKGKKFKARLEYAICTNKAIFNLLGDGGNDGDTAKNTIRRILPELLKLLGVSAGFLAGIWVGIIAAALALLLKLGYTAYCSRYWATNGNPNAPENNDNK